MKGIGYKDPETGKTSFIAYSQKLQKTQITIMTILLIAIIILIIMLALIYFNTGIIGNTLVRMVC